MNNGVIYVLTNPSFPDYVKIGYADNLEKRLSQLNQSECMPFAFRVYCVYEVKERLQDKTLHNLIDSINPDLRSIDNFDGKTRVREFYAMPADKAYDILFAIASISGTLDRLKKMKPEGHEIEDERLAEEIEDSGKAIYTEEYHLGMGSEYTVSLFEKLRGLILMLPGVSIEYKKYYIAFKISTNFCDIKIQKKKLNVFINMIKGTLVDKKDMTRDISDIGHLGNGDYCAEISDESDIDYVMELIRQSYEDKQNQ